MNKSIPPNKKRKRIWVSDDVTRKLKAEFDISGNTVLVALKFGSYSELSKKIRTRAMELITEEVQINEELMNEFHD